ncbi:hypothetical protein GC170_21260 [bacterium]|nr:hypothetical protein [bacterium]
MKDEIDASGGDRLLTPDQLASLVPSRRKGRNATAQTIRRWMFQGLRGKFLRYTRVGSIPCTSEKALSEFFSELTRDDEARRFVHVDKPANSPTQAAKAADKRTLHFSNRAKELGI